VVYWQYTTMTGTGNRYTSSILLAYYDCRRK
jgi:hypothetical protein